MSNVTVLSDYKMEKEPHTGGEAKCLACGHEWIAVSPLPVESNFDCPSCGTYKGVYKGIIGEPEGMEVFHCNCGNSVFTYTPYYIRCVCCGTKTEHDDLI